MLLSITALFLAIGGIVWAQDAETRYPSASHLPDSQPGWQTYRTESDPGAPLDEAQGGKTALGTAIFKRTIECFPAEPRNVFSQVDRVASGKDGSLETLKYDLDHDGQISDHERDAIRGQNTWMLWGEGNEAFWGWLQERGYGLHDFLILLDSRNRAHRFRDQGLINQPGMKAQTETTKKLLGLYLDQADGDKVKLRQSPNDPFDFTKVKKELLSSLPKNHPGAPFTPGPDSGYEQAVSQLPDDGVSPSIYGYPSGVIGLRLFPNPDFFGGTTEAKEARDYWAERVTNNNDAYYTDPDVYRDPKLVRPFRPAMTCAFCHVGPHPLSPPKDPEQPEWGDLSSTIGNQYWVPQQGIANLTKPDNFLYHFLASQQPGTIDTSLVSTDHINNANSINAIFQVPARLERASLNPPERQRAANLQEPGIEDGLTSTNPRHTPRVLLDGADSIGVFGALARVYLNIGTFSEEWRRCHNPIIGFVPQKPFSLATCTANSVYWRTAQKYRTHYLASFFTLQSKPPATTPGALTNRLFGTTPDPLTAAVVNASTAPMEFAHTIEGKAFVADPKNRTAIKRGQQVFLQNCAICHSSKQPDGFELDFSRDWQSGTRGEVAAGAQASGPQTDATVPSSQIGTAGGSVPSNRSSGTAGEAGSSTHTISGTGGVAAPLKNGSSASRLLTLPMDYSEWELFKHSPAYLRYAARVTQQCADEGPSFFANNYMSTDIRVPVTLVGTNSGRAVATNGMSGQVWDNFTSEDYKHLPAVGAIHFYNPYSKAAKDSYGFNDYYEPPGGGPGYYRPASLVGIWATAPFLHNNSLGKYNHDPSVKGRIDAFEDAIDKLLWNSHRVLEKGKETEAHAGDLRYSDPECAANDPGYIYRTTQDSWVEIGPRFIQPLIAGVIGDTWIRIITWGIGLVLFAVFVVLAYFQRPRHLGLVLTLKAVLIGAVLSELRVDRVLPVAWLLPVVLIGLAYIIWYVLRDDKQQSSLRLVTRIIFILSALGAAGIIAVTNTFLSGGFGALRAGPIPKGTPVNLIMNVNPEAPLAVQVDAFSAVVRGVSKVRLNSLHDADALHAFENEAGQPLIKASKCPDFVLDRGHWFGEAIPDQDKKDLIAFLKTL